MGKIDRPETPNNSPVYKYLTGLSSSGMTIGHTPEAHSHYLKISTGGHPVEAEFPYEYLLGIDNQLLRRLPCLVYLRKQNPTDRKNYLSASDIQAFSRFIIQQLKPSRE